ncbi:MAG: DNA gyrase subunit A [Candidatus Hydrogenedentota bacterium]|nr:MAG: DNA gyrase subunit A [Candidatus Hydrogenedentota bacterium]
MTQDHQIVESGYIEEELKSSYIDYAMSVIVGRALPDVRDGLKPVHRRILHAMNEIALTYDRPFKKSATVVGEVLGKYHPHGDSAVYDTIVRMVQDFSLRYPLIDGQGNFGSIDGDSAAAYRYTEIRLQRIANELLEDIEEDTVDFVPNFDGSQREPTVLPARLPNLLLNGSAGIAVGMATNIPPHNLRELAAAISLQIDKPDCSVEDLMRVMPGPDFPTGGIIYGRKGIREAYKTGRGRIKIGGVATTETVNNKEAIVISELPYQVNKAKLLERIAELVRDKKIDGIADIRDESDRNGIRVVIELKRDAVAKIVLNKLQKHTALLETFGIIFLALVDNRPKVMGLKEIIGHYIDHRREVIRRRSEYLLKKAEEEAHIREGLLKAIAHIDEVIRLIRKSKNRQEAHSKLKDTFGFSDPQTKAILEMRLHRLTSLERIEEERRLADLLKEIERLNFILSHEQEILNLIKEDVKDLSEKYGDDRRTRIVEGDAGDFTPEDLIKNEDVIITISHAGYIKRQPLTAYRAQKRGGRGLTGVKTREDDFVEHLLTASTHDYLLFFTKNGLCHWLKVYDIPEASRTARGRAIVNLLRLDKDDRITAFVPVHEFEEGKYLVMATRGGTVKKTTLSAFSNPRSKGIIAIELVTGDELIDVRLTDGSSDVVLATKQGMAIRFSEEKLRPMGRNARGVRGINLNGNDVVVAMVIARKGTSLLTVCERGYGKRSRIEDYRKTNRGGKGVINIRVTEKNGTVVAVREVVDADEIMIATREGIMIRVKAEEIGVIGRATQGVRIIKLDENDNVSDVTILSQRAQDS